MPIIKLEKCIQCMKCVNDCPSNAIDISAGTISNMCIECGHCIAICPESTIYPKKGKIKKLKKVKINSTNFQNLTKGIRTCRNYKKKKVADETLNLLIKNMKHYPSASNARPIEIMVIKTDEIIQKLNDLTANKLIKTLKLITSPYLTPALKIFAPKLEVSGYRKYKNQFIERQVSGSSQVCHHAPSIMLFHAPKSKYGMESADAYIWATYTSIHAKTLGLGTCFNGFIVKAMERSKKMRTEFNIPANHQVYAALLIGYPKVKYINQTSREIPKFQFI